MNIKELAKKIKKLNGFGCNWIVLFIFTFIMGFIRDASSAEIIVPEEVGMNSIIPVIGVITVALGYNNYFNVYLNCKAEREKGIGIFVNLTDCFKYLAFPTREYFKYILKKILPVTVMLAIEYFAMAFIYKEYVRAIVAIVIIVLPFVVYRFRLFIFEYELTDCRAKIGYVTGKYFAEMILWIISASVILIVLFITSIIAVEGVSSLFAHADNGSVPSVRIYEPGDEYLLFLISGMVLFWVLSAMSSFKYKIVVVGIMLSVYVGLGTFSIVDEVNTYIKITGDKITVLEKGEKSEYNFEEIDKIDVKYGDEDDQYDNKIIFHMKDGKKVAIDDWKSYENNDAWAGEYKDLTEYIKGLETELAEKK
jgi:hypothetical protein